MSYKVELRNCNIWCHDITNKLHREDGPAVEYDDNPDIEYADYKSWWINGEKVNCFSQEEFENFMKLKAFW